MIEQEEYTKENAVRIEIDASFHYIKSGLLILKKEKSINYNRHITLQLLASGFERGSSHKLVERTVFKHTFVLTDIGRIR